MTADGRLYWLEATPWTSERHVVTWSPGSGCEVAAAAAGSDLHAYGGGVFAVARGKVWAIGADGGVGDVGDARHRVHSTGAQGDLSFGAGRLWLVREHGGQDELVAIDPDSGAERIVLDDAFLGSPQPAASQLAWVRWPATVMPWDAAEVWVADLDPDLSARGKVRVAGGPAEAALQPRWGPDGWLYFISDRSGWWNLYRWRDGVTMPVAPMSAECAQAPWEAGYRSYAFLPGGRIAVLAQRGPCQYLALVDGAEISRPNTRFTSYKPYLAALGDRVAVIGSAPDQSQQIAMISADGTVEVIRDAGTDEGPVTVPHEVQVPSAAGLVAALVYPAADQGAAPTIMRVHPGPTHHCEPRLDWEVQFFTSHGFTVVDVDYRGSTGYGRAFRTALNGAWGDADVEDCIAVARYLIAEGAVVAGAVFIAGASAGGYTAIRAVCRPDTPFALAAARSAIIDPNQWTRTAPRFQRPHAATLTHALAGIDPADVHRPVLIVHGGADAVAPAGDARRLGERLRQRGLLAGMVDLPGAGHYFAGDALVRALDAELAAYRRALSRQAGE
jgi:dipeptidyl aminopeptidase/acylaminoacyl peptidase